jgi:hypothetical protein
MAPHYTWAQEIATVFRRHLVTSLLRSIKIVKIYIRDRVFSCAYRTRGMIDSIPIYEHPQLESFRASRLHSIVDLQIVDRESLV